MKEIILDCVEMLPSVVAILAIIVGYRAWERELRGTTKFNLYIRTLANFYQARDAIIDILRPIVFTGEDESLASTNDNDFLRSEKNLQSVYRERYSRHKALFNNIQSQKYAFIAMFGPETESFFAEFVEILNDLSSTVAILYDPNQGLDKLKDPSDDEQKQISICRRKLTLTSEGQTEDSYEFRINTIISNLEKVGETVQKKHKKRI